MPDRRYRINSPALVPETALDNGDRVYTRAELDGMDYEELRAIAAGLETDVINGRSTKLEIISYCLGRGVDEF